MKKFALSILFVMGLVAMSVSFAAAQMGQMNDSGNPMVGGAAMYKTKNIVENAVNSKDHTTLVAAVKAAGLVETLQSAGPFTVFAPVNSAFDALPAGTVPNPLPPRGAREQKNGRGRFERSPRAGGGRSIQACSGACASKTSS